MIAPMLETLKKVWRSDAENRCRLTTDLHSHLIPGIDDGSRDIEESLRLVRGLYALGYRHLVTTPHTMSHRFPNTTDTILRGLDTLREAVEGSGIPVTIDAASEYYLDEHFLEQIRRKNLLTFGNNEVLFEMSYVIAPLELDTVLFELQSAGYTPVLAHPERYLYLHNDIEKYARLKAQGVRFQVNINSLGGYYSKSVQKAAKNLMERGWIDYLGSDAHHQRHVDALRRTLNSGIMKKIGRKNTIGNEGLVKLSRV
jgi:protein-tyrosine phosphatase